MPQHHQQQQHQLHQQQQQHNSAYGWSATTNPYVFKDHHNETYASINSFQNTSQDSYVRGGFQPTYAQAIPKNLRPAAQQHIYSNASVIARASPHGSHSSIEGCSRVTFVSGSANQTGGSGIGDASSRVSPDSSEQAPTPTKSILKKPKTTAAGGAATAGAAASILGANLDSLLMADACSNVSDRDSQASACSSSQHSVSHCSSLPKDVESRSGSQASSQASSHPSQLSTLPHTANLSTIAAAAGGMTDKSYLETSFEFGGLGGSQEEFSSAAAAAARSAEEAENVLNAFKSPSSGGLLAKPSNLDVAAAKAASASCNNSAENLSGSLDKKIRNCTQV